MSQKSLIRALFPVTFIVFFIAGLYLTFPGKALNGSIANLIESSLFSRTNPRMTEPAKVTIESVSLWRLSGVALRNVEIKEPGSEFAPGNTWKLNKLNVRVGLLGLLFGGKKISFSSDLYNSSLEGTVSLSKENQLAAASLYVEKLDLKNVPNLLKKIPLASGVISLDTELDFGKNPSQDAEGYLDLTVDGAQIYGVRPGNLAISMNFEKGQGKSKPIKMSGGDINAEANISLELAKDIMRSRIEGNGWFKFTPDFEKKNAILVAQFASRKDAQGQHPFRIYGTLDSPIPSWGALRSRSFDKNNPLRSFER